MRVRAFGVAFVLTLLLASSQVVVWSKASESEARRSTTAIAAVSSPVSLQAGDVAIIVNLKNSTRDISFDTLRKYFKAERGQWPNGTKVVIAMRKPPGQSERNAVLRSIYGWDENYFQKYFRQGQFNESIQQAPKELNTTYAMTQYVHYTPGAIGYVRADQVDNSKVNVLSVDGRKPGESDYRIR
jgi:ABC-type phosphate transport system substrate-binding protein